MSRFLPRSRSIDLGAIGRDRSEERWLSRWSRENTPQRPVESYQRHVRRSYTPVRELTDRHHQQYSYERGNLRARTPLNHISSPYLTGVNYYTENHPIRKFDVLSQRTWSYPIYKYIYERDSTYNRPYSYTRSYGTTSLYTTPKLTTEATVYGQRRGYSGYNYLAQELHFNVASRSRPVERYNFRRHNVASSPWYYSTYGWRTYNCYRSRSSSRYA